MQASPRSLKKTARARTSSLLSSRQVKDAPVDVDEKLNLAELAALPVQSRPVQNKPKQYPASAYHLRRFIIALAVTLVIIASTIIFYSGHKPKPYTVIPNKVHFIFLPDPAISQPNNLPFGISHFLCIKAAHDRIKPKEIHFHYAKEPSGMWWEKAKPFVTLRRVYPPKNNAKGNPLHTMVRQTDILRLHILLNEGGIYLDLDVLALKSFASLRRTTMTGFSMATELEPGSSTGLSHTVMLSVPGTRFLKRWQQEYETFNEGELGTEYWNYHSVQLPQLLATQHPEEITPLAHDFLWPNGDAESLRMLFRGTTMKSERENNNNNCSANSNFNKSYAVHLRSSQSFERYLSGLTVQYIETTDNNFNLLVRDLIKDVPFTEEEKQVDFYSVSFTTVIVCTPDTSKQDIERAVKSVQSQYLPRMVYHELFLVDTTTNPICKSTYKTRSENNGGNRELPPKDNKLAIRYFQSDEETTPWKARNFAIEKATGKWVCFLQPTEKLSATYFNKVLELGSLESTPSLVYTDQVHSFGSSRTVVSFPVVQKDHMIKRCPFPRAAVVRRSALEQFKRLNNVSVFRIDLYSTWISFWDAWLRLADMPEFSAARIDGFPMVNAFEPLPSFEQQDQTKEWEFEIYTRLFETLHPRRFKASRIISNHKFISKAALNDQMIDKLWSQIDKNEEGSSIVHCWKGILLDKMSRVDEANVEFQKAVSAADSTDWQPFWLLMHTQLELGYYKEAEKTKAEAMHRCAQLEQAIHPN